MRTALLVLLLACQADPSSLAERAGKHTMADRTQAMKALSGGLDEAYLALQAAPNDVAGALAKARVQIATYYTADEAAAFQLWTGPGEWMLYIPATHAPTVWLARNKQHLVIEPDALPADAKAKIGL